MSNRVAIIRRYGDPAIDRKTFERKFMAQWKIRTLFPFFPAKNLYLNIDLISPLINTLTLLESKGLHKEIKTFDGIFNVRCIRGYEDPCVLSIHAYGLAIDLNAKDNPLGYSQSKAKKKGLTPFTNEFFDVWRETGWTCGIDFKRKDGMHFQWTKQFE